MGIIEYKLEKGCICLTPCPALITKEDGEFVLVGSTVCMKCLSYRGTTFYEDGTGGMVKCERMKGPEMPMRGAKIKPSLARKYKEEAEDAVKNREIRAKRKEMMEKLREAKAKRKEQLKEMEDEKDKVCGEG